MRIAVIISTYNSPIWLEKVLWGYANQQDRGFEIIIADDGSRDDTRQLITRFTRETSGLPTIRHIWHEDRGFRKCAILNKAIVAAKEVDYLLFTDGDCIPRGDLVSVHRRYARPGRYLSGGYCKLPMATSAAIDRRAVCNGDAFRIGWLAKNGFGPSLKWSKIVARPLGLDAVLNAVVPTRPTFNGNNSSCWRADALSSGGFDERLGYGGEDREFGYRLVHAGVKPRVIRYSALMLHLDHPRGYKNAAIRAANEVIIAETLNGRKTRTIHGIN
jgi:glycosyltransferase involved in cell wall biosynthesis